MPKGVYERKENHKTGGFRGNNNWNSPESIVRRSASYRENIDSKVDWDECWSLYQQGDSQRYLANLYGVSKSTMYYRLKQIRLGLSAGENPNKKRR